MGEVVSQADTYTLTIVKPDAVAKDHIGDLIARFEQAGLHVAGIKMVQLSQQQAEQFYVVHKDRPFYGDLVRFMTSGPVVAVTLKGHDAVQKARQVMGSTDPKQALPGTIRHDFGESLQRNAVHGSDAPETAKTEVAFFFSPSELIK